MKSLILFWHGLGDCILATPALRKFKQTTGDFVGFMMLKRFESAQLFHNNLDVDRIHYCSDTWNDFGENHHYGQAMVRAEAEKVKSLEGYDRLIVVDHQNGIDHKIYRVARSLGVTLSTDELHTSFYLDSQKAANSLPFTLPHEPYIFFHGKTGLKRKDMPIEKLQEFNAAHGNLKVISPDFSWDISKTPISSAVYLMKHAEKRILVDSSLYHIAHALDLPVHYSWFARGKKVWDIVRPLHRDDSATVHFGNED